MSLDSPPPVPLLVQISRGWLVAMHLRLCQEAALRQYQSKRQRVEARLTQKQCFRSQDASTRYTSENLAPLMKMMFKMKVTVMSMMINIMFAMNGVTMMHMVMMMTMHAAVMLTAR